MEELEIGVTLVAAVTGKLGRGLYLPQRLIGYDVAGPGTCQEDQHRRILVTEQFSLRGHPLELLLMGENI